MAESRRKGAVMDRAIVLRRYESGEADRIYTMLCRRRGKLGVVARGVRKQESKLACYLQLFSVLDLELVGGRNLATITGVEKMAPGPSGEDIDASVFAAVLSEIADKATESGVPVPELFDMLEASMDRLRDPGQAQRAYAVTLAAFLHWLGMFPQLHACASCGQQVGQHPTPFSPAGGGLLCERCSDPMSGRMGMVAIRALQLLENQEEQVFWRLRMPAASMDEVTEALEFQIEYHLGARLRTLEFVRRMRIENLRLANSAA